MQRFMCSGLLWASVVLTVAGCGGPKLVPVVGKVTVEGQPLTKGTVQFVPETNADPENRTLPKSLIDGSGNYSLATAGRSGALEGKYRAVVYPPLAEGEEKINPANVPFNLKFSNARASPLTIQVEASPQAGAYDLKLTH